MALTPEPLRIPAFRAFWIARLATTIAQMAMVIVTVSYTHLTLPTICSV